MADEGVADIGSAVEQSCGVSPGPWKLIRSLLAASLAEVLVLLPLQRAASTVQAAEEAHTLWGWVRSRGWS
ncbi:hypothetical protein [Hydrogenophaga sp. BPS33]|uniref:hypothetical protein n=1 Tax=Hydrogenophaga sp. BPS33 TaxID=2651974 RepID=UPI00131F8E6D|nr:hypothetical protein [Hydrogenophaga sp. BPS33]QHE86246.1 hypothetical protein F9K07_15705 [Hydrogenophaga sp. BPS33]